MIKKTVLVMVAVLALVVGLLMTSGCVHRFETSVIKTSSGLQIVSYNEAKDTLVVMMQMDNDGLRPATLEEVMKEPKRATANGGMIYAIGSASTIPGDARVCYSVPGCPASHPAKYIDTRMYCDPEYKWPAGTNFGAMPK